MNRIRLFRVGWVVVLGAIMVVDIAFARTPSGATQAPRISLDMDPSGNTYDGSTMTVGAVDNCLTAAEGNNSQHVHTTHLVIQQVEDLVGWQARMNYDGARMRPSAVNFTPFHDSLAGQDISFVNLPSDPVTSEHRSVFTATNIPPPPAVPIPAPQTALIGSSYSGEQTAPFSADTPAKSPPDDYSYSAPAGGVLAAIDLQVGAGLDGLPGLYVDLDDGSPNGPGSNLVVFTGTGAATLSLAEDSLGDGFHGEGAPCLTVAPPAPPARPAIPSPPPPPEGSADSGETTTDHCPEDPNADHVVDISDIVLVGGQFGKAVPPAPAEYDISPELIGDGWVDISDIAAVGAKFGKECFGATGCYPCGDEPLSESQMQALALGSPVVRRCNFNIFSLNHAYSGAYSYRWWSGRVLCTGENFNATEMRTRCMGEMRTFPEEGFLYGSPYQNSAGWSCWSGADNWFERWRGLRQKLCYDVIWNNQTLVPWNCNAQFIFHLP